MTKVESSEAIGSREQGVKSAPKLYKAIGDDEK